MNAVLQEADAAQTHREDRKTGQFYYRPEANDDARLPAVKDINPNRDLIRDALYCPTLNLTSETMRTPSSTIVCLYHSIFLYRQAR
jgi:hypothetical protein